MQSLTCVIQFALQGNGSYMYGITNAPFSLKKLKFSFMSLIFHMSSYNTKNRVVGSTIRQAIGMASLR